MNKWKEDDDDGAWKLKLPTKQVLKLKRELKVLILSGLAKIVSVREFLLLLHWRFTMKGSTMEPIESGLSE